jgi:hypothetical protein
MNTNSKAQTETNQTKTSNDLHRAFASLEVSYAITEREITGVTLDCLACDCEKLAMIAKAMHLQVEGCQISSTNSSDQISMDDIIKEQTREQGLAPLRLESELLLKRVSDGGYSGQFLADAFISAYRTDTPFPHSLGGLIKLDAEGFRLFHQVLHIRHIPGWSDDSLYQIEKQIKAIAGGAK